MRQSGVVFFSDARTAGDMIPPPSDETCRTGARGGDKKFPLGWTRTCNNGAFAGEG